MIAKWGTLLLALIASVLLVRYLGWHNPNLAVSAIIKTAEIAASLYLVLRVRPAVVCWAGAGAFVIGLFIASMIAGDWEHHTKIASTCIVTPSGTFHNHHLDKGWVVSAIHLVLFFIIRRTFDEWRPGAVILFGRRLLRVAGGLIVAALAMTPFIKWEGDRYGVTPSMFFDTICYGLYLGLLALVCREGQTRSTWFTTYFAISFGMALSVFASGGLEFLKESAVGGKIPTILILWHSEGDPSCGP